VTDKLLLVQNFLFDELGLPRRLALSRRVMLVGFLKLTGFDLGVTALGVEPRSGRACLDFQLL